MGGGTGLKALVLLSGGLDSTTVLSHALSKGYGVTCLSFDYGQRHSIELESSKKIAERMGVERTVFSLNLRQFGGSSLTSDVCFTSHMKTNSQQPISFRTTANAEGFMDMIMPLTSRYRGNL